MPSKPLLDVSHSPLIDGLGPRALSGVAVIEAGVCALVGGRQVQRLAVGVWEGPGIIHWQWRLHRHVERSIYLNTGYHSKSLKTGRMSLFQGVRL